jgi:hypothetical protein
MWGDEKDAPPVPWADVERRLQHGIAYWVVTVAGSRPVWGIWRDDRLLLSVGSTVLWRGMGESSTASAHLEDAHDVVIVEGTTRTITDESELAVFCDVYNPKYHWDFTPATAGGIVELRPSIVLAWKAGSYLDAKADTYPLAASRFTFD